MKKIKKNQLIITALAIMIAAAGYINYTGNLSDIITVNDTVSTQDPTSNPVDEVSGDISSNDAEPDEQSLQEPGSVVLTSGNGAAVISAHTFPSPPPFATMTMPSTSGIFSLVTYGSLPSCVS